MPAQFDTIPDQKIAYLIMRKCGCSSLRHALSKIRDRQPVPEIANQIHCKMEHDVFGDELRDPEKWFKFTIVRDPIMRFLSFYANKILDQNLNENHTFRNRHRFGLLPNMSMDQVIEILIRRQFETEPHLLSQSELIHQVGFELDFIGHLEHVSRSLDKIEALTGIRLPLEHLNRAKQKPIVPTRKQFDKLAEFYRDDLVEFGYPVNYEDWCQAYVQGSEEKFQLEAGFTFENEAKLLKQTITRRSDRFVIELKWRVHASQSRKRVIQIVRKRGSDFEIIWHLPPRVGLIEDCDSDMLVRESVDIPFSRMPPDIDLDDVYQHLYFADEIQKRALLTDYLAHDNMLVFAFGHLKR